MEEREKIAKGRKTKTHTPSLANVGSECWAYSGFLSISFPFSLPWASSSRITDSVLAHGKGKGKRREKRPVPEDAFLA